MYNPQDKNLKTHSGAHERREDPQGGDSRVGKGRSRSKIETEAREEVKKRKANDRVAELLELDNPDSPRKKVGLFPLICATLVHFG